MVAFGDFSDTDSECYTDSECCFGVHPEAMAHNLKEVRGVIFRYID